MAEVPLLRATDITKSYAGVQALKSASLELRAGEVHALIGENGAGKSTLIKIITGAVEPDGGELRIEGEAVTNNSPRVAKALGVAAIYQQPALFPELTVAENVALGVEQAGMAGRVDWRARKRRAAELLAQVGARIDPDRDAGELTMPQQQLVEIARALGADAKVLILDEPTASLSEEDTQNLFNVIRSLRDRGVGMVYISHRLEELPVIADRVTVLRDGRTIDTRPMSEVNRQQLIQLMVGRELSAVFPKREVQLGDVLVELRNLGCAESGVKNVNLSVRAGEIVGLAGLVGAGRTELARAVFGLTPVDAGEILLRGEPVRIKSPAEAIRRGIAYLPEDRRRHGVPVATLSGGNQQKVALSRWLLTRPSVLILDEPTQGIDVGAKSEIHALMTDLAAEGVAVLMISSELPEILGMSDRVAVMYGGTIVEILDRADATQEKVLALALGHDAAEVAAAGAN
jgi:rhamnose transport system ATP-binding protein